MNVKAIKLILLAVPILSCCGCFESNDLGSSCCCIGPYEPPYWSHTNFCGGRNFACYVPPHPLTNQCDSKPTAQVFGDVLVDRSILKDLSTVKLRSVILTEASAYNNADTLDPALTNEADHSVSCLAKCPAGKTTADCLAGTINPGDADGLKHLFAKVASPETTIILPDELRAMFHIDHDACSREKTALNQQGLSNEGHGCSVEDRMNKPKLRLKLFVPDRLEGVWEARSPSGIRLKLTSKTNAVLRFENEKTGQPHPLNAEFGGAIQWVEADSHRLIVRTETKGCVGIQF
jgi:hypothetical protein